MTRQKYLSPVLLQVTDCYSLDFSPVKYHDFEMTFKSVFSLINEKYKFFNSEEDYVTSGMRFTLKKGVLDHDSAVISLFFTFVYSKKYTNDLEGIFEMWNKGIKSTARSIAHYLPYKIEFSKVVAMVDKLIKLLVVDSSMSEEETNLEESTLDIEYRAEYLGKRIQKYQSTLFNNLFRRGKLKRAEQTLGIFKDRLKELQSESPDIKNWKKYDDFMNSNVVSGFDAQEIIQVINHHDQYQTQNKQKLLPYVDFYYSFIG